MIETLRTWLLGVTAASFLLAAAESLVTQEAIRRVLRLAGGVLLVLVMLRPLLGLAGAEWEPRWEEYQARQEELTENFAREQQEELAAIIAAEVAAYISDKAEEMGLDCTVTVETGTVEGVPLPRSVSLSIPRQEALSRWLAEELNIKEDAQRWQEK